MDDEGLVLDVLGTRSCGYYSLQEVTTATYDSSCHNGYDEEGCVDHDGHNVGWSYTTSFVIVFIECDTSSIDGTGVPNNADGTGSNVGGSSGGSSKPSTRPYDPNRSNYNRFKRRYSGTLSRDEPNLLELNPFLNQQFYNYLVANNFSSEDESFALLGLEVIQNGGEFDFDDDIIIDASFRNNPKMKCIFDKLKVLRDTYFRDVLVDVFRTNQDSHIAFRVTDNFIILPNGDPVEIPAITSPRRTESGDIIYFIDVDPDFINESSMLLIATALVHEVMHAEIFERLLELNIIELGFDANGEAIPIVIDNDYSNVNPSLFRSEALNIYLTEYFLNPEWAHEQMSIESYRNDVMENIAEFHDTYDDSSFIDSMADDGIELDEIYEALGWFGLNRGSTFEAMTQEDQDAIMDIINLTKENSDGNCN